MLTCYGVSFDLKGILRAFMLVIADILAGRKTVGKIEGSLLFAGHKPTRRFLRRYSSYVEQFGGHSSAVTAHICQNCKY